MTQRKQALQGCCTSKPVMQQGQRLPGPRLTRQPHLSQRARPLILDFVVPQLQLSQVAVGVLLEPPGEPDGACRGGRIECTFSAWDPVQSVDALLGTNAAGEPDGACKWHSNKGRAGRRDAQADRLPSSSASSPLRHRWRNVQAPGDAQQQRQQQPTAHRRCQRRFRAGPGGGWSCCTCGEMSGSKPSWKRRRQRATALALWRRHMPAAI